jgi:hypothetical protein
MRGKNFWVNELFINFGDPIRKGGLSNWVNNSITQKRR